MLDVQSNPSILGEDVASMAWTAVGVAGVGALNDRITSPLLGRFLPASFFQETVGKVVDGSATMVTAYVAGEAVGMIDRPVGRKIRFGGLLLGLSKWLSIVVPGFALSGSLPGGVVNRIPSFAAPKEMPALAAGAVNTQTLSQIGVSKMGI